MCVSGHLLVLNGSGSGRVCACVCVCVCVREREREGDYTNKEHTRPPVAGEMALLVRIMSGQRLCVPRLEQAGWKAGLPAPAPPQHTHTHTHTHTYTRQNPYKLGSRQTLASTRLAHDRTEVGRFIPVFKRLITQQMFSFSPAASHMCLIWKTQPYLIDR